MVAQTNEISIIQHLMKKRLLFFASIAIALSLCFTACDPKEDPIVPDNNEPEIPEIDYFEGLDVSTNVKKRNAVIEEFTGVQCGYCPDGHAIVRQLMEEFPSKILAINIHQGGYATRYTTQWGDALAQLVHVTGYPCATINRHEFTGGMAQSRNMWRDRANNIKGKNSCVNLAARAVIDTTTRHMTVMVKGHYTANSDSTTNRLNIALLQNDIVGPQSNYGNYNPEGYDASGKYHHMHMLRDLLTGQWGDLIEETTKGTDFTKVYEYDIPETISNEAVVLSDLEVIAFINLDKIEVITGVAAEIIFK